MTLERVNKSHAPIISIKVKVLQVTASIAARDGGPSTVIVGINKFLRTHGSDSIIITTDADGPRDRLPVPTNKPCSVDGSATWFSRRNRPYTLKNSWSLGHRIWALTRSQDVVHIHGVYLAHSMYAFWAARLRGKPYVLQPHGTLEQYQQAQGWAKKLIYNKVVGDRIIRGASCLIAASQSERANILDQYPGQEVAVIDLPVTETESQPVSSQTMPVKWLAAPASKRVIFLGRLANKKRPDLLIKAWNGVVDPAAQLLFVGPQQDWTAEALRSLLHSERQDSVHFLESQPRPQVAWCLEQAAIFVLPSENENYGIAVAEAMWHECAVITTEETASSDHVAAADGGEVVKAGDLAGLTNSIEKHLAHPSATAAAARAAHEYSREKLTWERAISDLVEVYNDAIQGRNTATI